MAPTRTAAAQRSCCSDSGATAPAHVVGDAFTRQYYDQLHRSPEEAFKFYHDDSCLAWPSASGAGTDCVTTLLGIHDKIMETVVTGTPRAEILTVDSHHSTGGGIMVLVTGTVAGDALPRAFVQSFFLAPQEDGGFYVRNDTLRYVGATLQGANSPAMAVAALAGADEKKGRKSPGSQPSSMVALATGEKETDCGRGGKAVHRSNPLGYVLGKLRRLLLFRDPPTVSDEKEMLQAEKPQALAFEREENGFVVIDQLVAPENNSDKRRIHSTSIGVWW